MKLRAGLDSDHVPRWVKVKPKMKLHNERRPIRPWVFHSAAFKAEHQRLLNYVNAKRPPTSARLEAHKQVIKKASRRARNMDTTGFGFSLR